MGCHFLLQGIFPTQGSNPGLLHWWTVLYHCTTWEVTNPESLQTMSFWVFMEASLHKYNYITGHFLHTPQKTGAWNWKFQPSNHLAEVCWSGFLAVWLFLSFHFPSCALCSKTVRRSPHLRSGFIFHKIPRRNTGVKLQDFCFSSRISGHQKHKQRKKKQTYRTLKRKPCISGHYQESEETTYSTGENTCKFCVW